MTSVDPVKSCEAGQEYVAFGDPDQYALPELLRGPGDLWHSGLERGCGGLLGELKYWSACGWWYLNEASPLISSVSWRVDATGFVARRSAWESLGGFDLAYTSGLARGLDFGFRLLNAGGVPLHVPELFRADAAAERYPALSRRDLYLFFVRHFKREYRLYMLFRETLRRRRPAEEWRAWQEAEGAAADLPAPKVRPVRPRALRPLSHPVPKVSVVIPTMGRQEYTASLLEDYCRQTLPPHEIFVVDATPEGGRRPGIYEPFQQRLPLRVVWQKSLGSCRARNEAIRASSGDYIVFGDDDTKILPDFLESHVRLLETYGAPAANGLDIRADHHLQTSQDLARKAGALVSSRVQIGVDDKFSNANGCVRRSWVEECVGNDVNFDGGYGEDGDFGHCLRERGAVVLRNPYSANLHLKPPQGGFRWWGEQAKRQGRRRLPWEIHRRVGWLQPKPSPTIVYGLMKHYTRDQVREWFVAYVLRSWWPRYGRPEESTWRRIVLLMPRMLKTPLTLARIRVACGFAGDLLRRGPVYE
jgi:GT2 family glycosyltransferase